MPDRHQTMRDRRKRKADGHDLIFRSDPIRRLALAAEQKSVTTFLKDLIKSHAARQK